MELNISWIVFLAEKALDSSFVKNTLLAKMAGLRSTNMIRLLTARFILEPLRFSPGRIYLYARNG